MPGSDPDTVVLRWEHGNEFTELIVNMRTTAYAVVYSSAGAGKQFRFQSGEPQADYCLA